MAQIPVAVFVIVGSAVAALLLLMVVFANLYRKAGPHEALVVYGFRGTRVIKGHGTVIIPMIESCRELSLELMSFDVAPQQELYTKQGVAVTVEAVAQIKVKSDPESILTASEQFLTKPASDREGLIRLVTEGHLRGIIGQLTVEEIVKQPEMVADRMRSTWVEKEQQVKVQEAEIARREKELIATVLKQAEIERQRIQTLAEAERSRTMVEAKGRASAIRAQGDAEAEIIFKKGDAEARAMNVKAEAYQEYNQAAVVDKLITGLPEVVKALASPLAKVDRITIVSTGDGNASGMHKLTGDLTQMAAQVPALFESLSGMQMSELLGKIRTIGDRHKSPNDPPSMGTDGKAKS